MKYMLIGLALLLSIVLKAQSSGFGAGIIIGEPTGVSLKWWIAGDRAIDAGLAWSLSGDTYFSLHADYLFHNMELIKLNKGRLPLYYGPGARLRTWTGDNYWENDHSGSRARFGVRFPVGLDYLPDNSPVDIFLEIAPALDLLPSTSFDVDGGIGVRYWF